MKSFYLDDIEKDTGMDEIDWVKKVYKKYEEKGDYFTLYVLKERFDNILNNLSYYGQYHYDLMGFLTLTKIKIEKTKGKERLNCYKRRIKNGNR